MVGMDSGTWLRVVRFPEVREGNFSYRQTLQLTHLIEVYYYNCQGKNHKQPIYKNLRIIGYDGETNFSTLVGYKSLCI